MYQAMQPRENAKYIGAKMKICGSACIVKSVYFALQYILGKETDLFLANCVLAFRKKLKDKTYTKQYTRTNKQFKIGDTKYRLRIDAFVMCNTAVKNNVCVQDGEPKLMNIKISIMGLNHEEYIDLSKFISMQEDVVFEETCLVPYQESN